MKSLFVLLSAAVIAVSSCADDGPSKDGEEQVPQPVENSGPNTEGQRAVEATVNDSTDAKEREDSANRNSRRDSTANK